MIRALAKEKEWAGILSSIRAQDLGTSDRQRQELILRALAKTRSSVNDLGNRNVADKKKGLPNQNDRDTKTTDAIFIRNAGLIILHPFLAPLFEDLGLTENNKWVTKQAQHRAVSILAFLVTEKEEAPEFTLALNKILCGLETEDVLIAGEALDDSTMAACEELLVQVIGHWTILKNTGTASLRETFLQRNGKLTQTDHGRLLQVEQKGVDILLNNLPWGIGVIKLPWMGDILYTEWNG